MKKLIIILFFILTACSPQTEKVPERVPTVSVENFESDTEEVLKIIYKAFNESRDFTETEWNILESYNDKYFDNPKLNKEQQYVTQEILALKIHHMFYMIGLESNEEEDIIRGNESVQTGFDMLRSFEEEGYRIK